MVPEIWSVTDKIVCHSGPLFPLFDYDHNRKVYCSWDMARDGCNCYFSFWVIFCIFTPLTCPKNENFKKMKNTPGHIIILHKCTKNHDHTVPEKWRVTDVTVIFHFGLFFNLPPLH